jgi:SpoVK/Ycf46/Vps4 family AAA+-type ATPase
MQYQPGMFMFKPVQVGSDDLMEFPDTKSGKLVAEIEEFWELKPKFKKHGFRHKRGYLLWGPPGSGKSCTVNLVIRRMVERGGVVILAGNPHVLAPNLKEFREVEPNRPLVVVWEDFDECINEHGPAVALSILDGDNQIDNVVFIATTNYPERLDSRFMNRPNRFDRIVKIDMPSAEARAQFLRNRAGDTNAPDGTDLIRATEGFSFAHLKELVVGVWCQGFAVDGVLERLRKMKYVPKSSEPSGRIGFNGDEGCIVLGEDDDGEESEVNII